MNNSGKTLTIFLIVIALLLVSLTAIAVFFFLKEVDLRKAAEYNLEQLRIIESKLQVDLKEAKKQVFLLEEKAKEADAKIESLLEEVELEQGLREEIKKESKVLQDALEEAHTANQQIREEQDAKLADAEEKIVALQDKLNAAIKEKDAIDGARQDLQEQINDIEPSDEGVPEDLGAGQEVDLDKIVVNPADEGAGEVISVDTETEFLIVSLGEKDGIKKGAVLSLSRKGKYLGDIQVSRVLPEMAAADFVSPLSSDKVKKGDQVIVKE